MKGFRVRLAAAVVDEEREREEGKGERMGEDPAVSSILQDFGRIQRIITDTNVQTYCYIVLLFLPVHSIVPQSNKSSRHYYPGNQRRDVGYRD